MTLLPIIQACDNFRIHTSPEHLTPFYIHVPPKQGDATIGFLRPSILEQLERYNQDLIAQGADPIWEIVSHPDNTAVAGAAGSNSTSLSSSRVASSESKRIVGFAAMLSTPSLRSTAMENMLRKWVADGAPFADLIAGRMWRDELYMIYYQPFVPSVESVAFTMERAATPLFGVVTYGVHLTAYTSDYRIWIPRRSKTKQTFGGMLDNTVAGGIPLGYTAYDSMVKECMEEASLKEEVVVPNMRTAGAISYFYQTTKGWLQPEVEYIYDMLVPPEKEDDPNYTPKPFDGEAESFELLPLDVVREKMLAGEFKPNCALVMLDFMIRHGKVNVANEPNLLEILNRLHGDFGYKN